MLDFERAPMRRFASICRTDFYSAGVAGRFLSRLHYVPLDINHPDGFKNLAKAIGDPCHGVGIFLSTAPSLFKPVIDGLEAAGLACPTVRMALEKPLGTDLDFQSRDQRRGGGRLSRGPHLPHRSLSRQGNGPEPDRAEGSPIRCSSRCGTARTLTMCRSLLPKLSGWKVAGIITIARARCATWSRTTCCSCSLW